MYSRVGKGRGAMEITVRRIRFYNKNDEKLAGEMPINIDIGILRQKYGNKEYDPMLIYSYRIKPDDARFFLQFLDHNFDFLKYDYFLEPS